MESVGKLLTSKRKECAFYTHLEGSWGPVINQNSPSGVLSGFTDSLAGYPGKDLADFEVDYRLKIWDFVDGNGGGTVDDFVVPGPLAPWAERATLSSTTVYITGFCA